MLTVSGGRVCFLRGHGDPGSLGQVRATPPHPHLHQARTLIHRVLDVAKVEDGFCEEWNRNHFTYIYFSTSTLHM